MSYKVRIDSFEGPFDLLLYLVSRQKVDIGVISISEIIDQYLTEVSSLKDLDLDVASDFLLVAATLLKIKAESLLPKESVPLDDEFAELSPSEARDILIERLLAYKQYKNAAHALNARFKAEGRMHGRPFGPDREFLGALPDFLANTSLEALGELAAKALARREIFLLQSEHIAPKPIPVETYVRSIHERIQGEKRVRFSQLLGDNAEPQVVVVVFLAVLELYKRTLVTVHQHQPFGDIDIEYIEGSGALLLDDDNALTSVVEG